MVNRCFEEHLKLCVVDLMPVYLLVNEIDTVHD